MNFDFGEILSSAFKITWKHKIMWLFSALPTLLSFIIFPFVFVPVFLIPILLDNGMTDFNPRTMMLFMGGFSLIFIPVMGLIQGITLTFMKSTYTLVYLRLTKSQDNALVVLEENA